MAANDRESTFTIKAADLSTQQINQVIATVERLVGVMEKANKATQDGTIKTTDFNKAQKDLGTGADAVARQITTLQRYAAVREEVAQREQKLADMRARADELAASNDLNRGEKAELNRLTKDKGQIEQAQKSLDRQNETFAKSEQAMAAMGSSAATLGADLDRLRGFAQQVQAAVDAAAAAQLHLTENQMKAAETAKAEAAAQQALARALLEIENVNKAAAKDAEQAAKAAANTIKEVNQAEVAALGEVGKAIKDAENAQKARTKQREADMQAQLDQYNFEQRVNKLALADADARLLKEKQLAEARAKIDAQRNLATDALARNRAATQQALEPKEQIVGVPSKAHTLVGTKEEIEEVSKLLRRKRDELESYIESIAEHDGKISKGTRTRLLGPIESEIKRLEEEFNHLTTKIATPISSSTQPGSPVQDYSKVSRGLSGLIDPAAAARQTIDGLTGAIDKLLNTIESGTRKPKDLESDLRKLGNAAQDLKRMGGLIDTFQAQEAAIKKADAAVKEIEAEMDRLAVKGRTLTEVDKAYQNEVKQTEAELNRRRQALEQENREWTRQAEILQRAGINYRNLGEDVSRLRATASGLGKTFTEAAEKAEGKKGTLFLGLRPYELQNLSYQVNDILTQLGSGTPIMQVFAQQGGQVFQLFQMQLLDVLKSLRAIPFAIPGIVAGVAALTVGFLAFARAMEEMAAQRTIMAQLAMDVDGAAHSAPGLMEAARAAERLGAGFEEAAKGGALLARSGFSRAQIQPMLELAAKFSVNTGKTFADSLKLLSEGFTGGYEAARKLSGEYGLLTDAQDKRIRDLVNENKLEEAHAELLTLVTARINEGYTKGLSPFSKAVLDLKNNWHDLLDEIGKWDIWTELVNRLTTTAREVKAIIDAIKWLDEQATRPRFGQRGRDAADAREVTDKTPPAGATPEQLKAQIKALEQRLEMQERAGATPAPLAPTTPKTPGYGGEGFTAARDQVADMVGLDREAMKRLQESEGVWIAAQKRWMNAHENPNTPESHATGPMQLQPGTFDALKKQFPDLITGDINDLKSNLIAGAIELRKQIEAAGGNFRKGVEGYHMGSVNVAPNADAVKQGDQVAAGFVGPAIQTNNPAATRAALASVRAQLAEVEKAGPAAVAAVEGVGTATNSVVIVTRNWAEQQDKATRAQEANVALNFEQRQKRLTDAIKESDEAVIKSAADFAKLPENAGRLPDPAEIKRVQAERAVNITRQFAEKESAIQNGLATELEALREAEGNKDVTNLAKRQAAFNTYWDARERKIKEAQRLAADQGQADQPGAMEEVKGLRAQAESRMLLETANAIVDKVEKQRKEAIEDIRQTGKYAGEAADVIDRKVTEAIKNFAPRLREAQKAASDAIANIPESEATRTVRARIHQSERETLRPPEADSVRQEAISRTSEQVTDAVKAREDQLAAVSARIKGGEFAGKFDQALAAAVGVIEQTTPAVNKAIEETNAALERLIGQTTDPAVRARLRRIIEENKLAQSKQSEELEQIITEALKDDQESLTRILAERDKKIAHIQTLVNQGHKSAADGLTEIASILEESRGRVRDASGRLVQDYKTALAQPNLRPGFQDTLRAGQADAETRGDTTVTDTRAAQAGIQSNLAKLQELKSVIDNTRREQSLLLSKGQTTMTASEEAVRGAYAKTNTEAAALIPILERQIDGLEKMGGHAADVAKLRSQVTELKSEFEYIPPLQQQIMAGLEQSFVARGSQAFEAIAKSIADVITSHGKLKDVIRGVGTAFAQFAAGVLEDVARIIIKYELLKLIKDALGIDPHNATQGTGGTAGLGATALAGVAPGLLTSALSGTASAGGGLGSAGASLFSGLGSMLSNLFKWTSGLTGGTSAGELSFLSAAGSHLAGLGSSASTATSSIGSGVSATASGIWSWLSSLFTSLFHEGGVVGVPGGMSRQVDLSLFHNANRMHSGGVAGIAPDEVRTILQRGEEVLPKNDPRNVLNGGKQQQQPSRPTAVRNVLAVGDKEIASAMNSSHGEQVVLNVLRRNSTTVKQMIG